MAKSALLGSEFYLSNKEFEPAYLALYESGELSRRAEDAVASLERCMLCPRDCGVNRLGDKKAACKSGRYAKVSSYFPHFGEEDCLRGWKGSGTIFFSMCNLRCVFCQNYAISQNGEGREVRPTQLAEMMLELQAMGCHNINFVTPEHVVPQILEALPIAIEAGLHLPLVYNTSAYDSIESMQLMDRVVDIYMPDFKYWDERLSLRYLLARDYPKAARRTLRAMHSQVGELKLDENGLARRGVLVRHLVMPGGVAGSELILAFLANELSLNTYIHIMGQYHPAGRVDSTKFGEINRPTSWSEVDRVTRFAHSLGLKRIDNRTPADPRVRWGQN